METLTITELSKPNNELTLEINPDEKAVSLINLANNNTLKKRLYDLNITTSNAPYTIILQNYAAKYQAYLIQEQFNSDTSQQQKIISFLQEISELFIPLEKYINTQDFINTLGPNRFLEKFSVDMQNQQGEILAAFNTLMLEENIKKPIYDNLEKQFNIFLKNIEEISPQENITKDQALSIMSVQTRAFNLDHLQTDMLFPSLGEFIAQQLITILDAAIKTAYEIDDNRLLAIIKVPKSVAILSDAKAMIAHKAFALDTAISNNTYSTTPENLLNTFQTTTTTLNLKPYLSHSWDIIELDRLLCNLLEINFDDRTYYSLILAVIASITASAIELCIHVPVFLLFAIGMTIWDLVLVTINLLPISSLHNIIATIREDSANLYTKALGVYKYLSPLFAFKEYWNKGYKRNNADQEYNNLLQKCAVANNFYHEEFNKYKPQQITQYIQDFFTSIGKQARNMMHEWQYLLTSFKQGNSELVYNKARILSALQPKLDKSIKDKDTIDYIKPNHVDSPLDVPVEVMSTLCHVVIDPMFRKSPGPATLYFMLSMATFGTYFLPAAACRANDIILALQNIANVIGKTFTGKAIEGAGMSSLFQASISCFLEWKIMFFSTEFILEVSNGNVDFLETFHQDPETYTLGAISLIGIGMCLGLIPNIPEIIPGTNGLPDTINVFAAFVNLLSEEANECMFTPGLEQGFLGLKFLMLLQNMSSGTRKSYAQFEYDTQKHFQTLLLKLEQDTTKDVDSITNIIMEYFHHAGIQQEVLYQFARTFANNMLSSENPDLHKAYTNFQHIFNQTLVSNQSNNNPLESSRQELLDALKYISQEKQGLPLQSYETNAFYDHLNNLFDKYNAEVEKKEMHGQDKQKLLINKAPFLETFYNCYCYKSSNNFLRLLIFFPLPIPPYNVYPLVAGYRLLKLAAGLLLNKPSVVHQVRKSFNKDLVLLLQVLGVVTACSLSLMRGISYTLRAVIGGPLFILGALCYPFAKLYDREWTRKLWFKTLDNSICKLFSLHKITPYFHRTIHALYASAARIAGNVGGIEEIADNARQLVLELGGELSLELGGKLSSEVCSEKNTAPQTSGNNILNNKNVYNRILVNTGNTGDKDEYNSVRSGDNPRHKRRSNSI